MSETLISVTAAEVSADKPTRDLLELIRSIPEETQNKAIIAAIGCLKSTREAEVEKLQKRLVELKTLISQLP